MLYIFLFIFSLTGIIVALSIKALEDKRGFKVLPSKVSLKFDKKVIAGTDYLKKQASEFDLKKVYNITKKSVDKAGRIYSTSFEKISEKVNYRDIKIVKLVKGRKILNRNGKSSKFLQDVAEHKRNLRSENTNENTEE